MAKTNQKAERLKTASLCSAILVLPGEATIIIALLVAGVVIMLVDVRRHPKT